MTLRKRDWTPKVNQTSIARIEDRHVILVDDVGLCLGRTIRAAMNEFFDFGRPASITLAILYDWGSMSFLFQADLVARI